MAYSGIFMTKDEITLLTDRLKSGLPGKVAQEIMAPSLRLPPDEHPDYSLSLPSGVLILLFPSDGDLETVFIQRTSFGLHGGQISLPGGKKEEQDVDITETALREATEEIGVDRNKIMVIGRLTPLYVPHSNFCITPVVGFQEGVPVFKINEGEVQSVIRVKLKDLFDQKNRAIQSFSRAGYSIEAPCYMANGHIVWGATAMIMSEFESLVR